MIFRLDERLLFPDPTLAEPDGLLAVDGDLSAERLILAYQQGIFPWYSDETPILWYSPHERFVIYPAEVKVSKSLNKVIRSGLFTVTFNKNFPAVIKACSITPRKDQDGTWITADMIAAYTALNQQGVAHSVEIWEEGILVGGLYGVAIGRVFCGESMFSLVSNASKVAMVSLCRAGLYNLIDCQFHTEHLESMGARMISRKVYMDLLQNTIH